MDQPQSSPKPVPTQTVVPLAQGNGTAVQTFLQSNNWLVAVGGTAFSLGVVILTGGLLSPAFFILYLAPLLANTSHYLITPLLLTIGESVILLAYFVIFNVPTNNLLSDILSIVSPIVAGGLITWQMKKRDSAQLVKEKMSSEKQITQYLRLVSVEKTQLEEVLQSIEDGVIVVDKDGSISLASRRALELLNTALAKIKGRIIEEVLPLEGLAGKNRGRINLRSLDGQLIHISLRLFPLKDNQQQVKGTIYILRDVTKEDELEEMKLDFVSSVAHQLRTPITTIRSYLSVLIESLENKLAGEDKEFLNRTMIVANQLSTLVENLLNVMKIEKGRLSVNIQPTKLEPLIEQTVDNMTTMAQQQGIKLVFEKPTSPFPQVKGDKSLIQEVLTNLIINAINFNHKGGWVMINLQRDAQSVVVHVRDSGKGISLSSIPYVFNRFYKVADEYIMESKGMGLGLYLSKSIVQALGGKIWVNSLEGKGSTFSFSLPLAS